MPLFTCPPGDEIQDLAQVTCFQDFGEIRGYLYQRTYSSGTTQNTFVVATNDPASLASWQTYLNASDGTKVTQSPALENVQRDGGDARTTGGGGESLGGTEIVKGSNPTRFTGMHYELPQWHIWQLKQYQQEIISVYFINEYGQIGGIGDKVDGTSITTFKGIPIAPRTLFYGDLQFGLYENRDGNAIQFSFLPNWSDYFAIVTPTDFDPRLYIPLS